VIDELLKKTGNDDFCIAAQNVTNLLNPSPADVRNRCRL